MEAFYLNIPGIDPKEIKAARLAAKKDMNEEKKSSKKKKRCKKE